MTGRRALVGTLLAAALARPAAAQESLDEIAGGAKQPPASVNGYLDNRLQYSWIAPGGLLPTRDLPSIHDLLEANAQLKVPLGSKAFTYGDVSLLFQMGGLYYTSDGMGGRVEVPDHDVPSLRPFVATNELYLSVSPLPWLHFLVGKKRIVWGSGLAFNPTDLVNPGRDPTDPSFQRAGAWVARVEAPFEKVTFTLLAAPSVLYQSNGLPYAVLKYPDYQPAGETARDDQLHYLLAARVYALVYNTDVNLMYFFSNRYRDGFENTSRLGVSLSRYFFTDYELHLEALFQQGSARNFVDHACVSGGPCADPRQAFGPRKLRSDTIYPRVLVGGRTMFRDESTLSIEYYYQADGYSDLEFEDTVRGLARLRPLLEAMPAAVPGSSAGVVPNRFSFDPQRRHYLIVSYSKPRIRDDWTASLTLIAGLTDLSGLVTPSVAWNAREWLTLTLMGFVPIRGIPVNQAIVDGQGYSEYSLVPFDWRVLFQARAFY